MPSPSVLSAPAFIAAVACFVVTQTATAQRIQARAEVPIAVQGAVLDDPAKVALTSSDPGPVVRMLESPNVDRFLRRAQDFLGRSDWPNAVRVLQDVIEGRTLEETVEGAEPARPAPPTDPAAPATNDAPGDATNDPWRNAGESSTQSVFSSDERLYRPVQRLCHELLASMPAEGSAWYRTQFEVIADRAFAAALAERDVPALESVYNRFFLTRAAGRALRAVGDLMMDQGRMRAAHQAYRLLLDVYPEASRREAGIDDLWVRARVTLCLALLGERAGVDAAIAELGERHAEDSLRIEGELVPVKGLVDSATFRAIGIARSGGTQRTPMTALRGKDDSPVPLFEHRFTDEQPYRAGRGAEDNGQVVFLGSDNEGPSATPKYADLQPGTSVTFLPGGRPDAATLAFLDHFRLTLVDVPSGKVRGVTNVDATVPNPTPGTPRTRIPAYDWSVFRVTSDANNFYTVLGMNGRKLAGIKPVTRTTLEARRQEDLALVWSTETSNELRDCTFLAAPLVENQKLYVPAMYSGTYWLLCLDANHGGIVFRTPIHRDGTELVKPPAVPVALDSGTAYVLTNAGAFAAIDVLSGGIKWIRRYERSDPLRPVKRPVNRDQRQNPFGGAQFFRETPLDGFAPSDVVLHEGLVVFAPSDGHQLLCLDGSTGEPRWMCERRDMLYLMGADAELLFVGGEDSVTAIHLSSGLRLWRSELPAFEASSRWRGRGLVTDGLVLVPGQRVVHVMPVDASSGWTTMPLPSFRLGRDPLGGLVNLFASGPWMAAVHAGGVEVFSTVDALRTVAEQIDDPLRRAILLAQAGELRAAIDALEAVDVTANPAARDEVGQRMVALCAELALAYGSRGARDNGLAVLARARARIDSPRLVQRWHLARIEMFQALGDLDAMAEEQQALYKLMETGG